MSEQTLVGGDTDAGAFDLTAFGLSAQLPCELAHLRKCLCGNGFAEARETTGRIDRDAASDTGVTRTQKVLGLAPLAQREVFDPVQFHRGSEVVDLGDVDVFGRDPGFLVRGVAMDSLNVRSGAGTAELESVEKFGISMIVCGNVGVTVEIALMRTGSAMPILRAYSIDVSKIAAPPSDVAQMSSR